METKDKNEKQATEKLHVQLLEPARENLKNVIELSAVLASRSDEMPAGDRKEVAGELREEIGNLINFLDLSDSRQALLSSLLMPMVEGIKNFGNLQPEKVTAWETQGCSVHLQVHNLAKIFDLEENGIDISVLEENLFGAISRSRTSALELALADIRPLLRKHQASESFYSRFDVEGYGTPD